MSYTYLNTALIEQLLKTPTWIIFTAENPDNKQLPPRSRTPPCLLSSSATYPYSAATMRTSSASTAENLKTALSSTPWPRLPAT